MEAVEQVMGTQCAAIGRMEPVAHSMASVETIRLIAEPGARMDLAQALHRQALHRQALHQQALHQQALRQQALRQQALPGLLAQ